LDWDYNEIVFTDSKHGWLMSSSWEGWHIFYTNNGGLGGIVSVEDNNYNYIISNFILEQNYPNPFNPTTTELS